MGKGTLSLNPIYMDDSYLNVNQSSEKFQKELKEVIGSSEKGIYKLYYFDNGDPRTIQRLFSKDIKGVLYVGMTNDSLMNRVGELQRALLSNWEAKNDGPASSGHTQIGKKYYRIRKKINIDDLRIQIFPDDNPKRAETDALESYVLNFAELPPLNGQYGSFEPEWSKLSY